MANSQINKNEHLLSFLEALEHYSEKTELKKYIKYIYEDNKRHSYSTITKHIYSDKILTRANLSEYLGQICDNLRDYIDKRMDKDFENEIEKYKANLEKMYDHISLESIRLNYSKGVEQDTLIKIENSKKSAEKKYKEIEEDISKQRNQYVAILGIFAAIILAFVGGMTFSNSVLVNMHQVSIYRLTFAICLIALFFGNILFALFDFINSINNTNKPNKIRHNFNIFFVAVMFVDFLVWLLKNEFLDKIQILRFYL